MTMTNVAILTVFVVAIAKLLSFLKLSGLRAVLFAVPLSRVTGTVIGPLTIDGIGFLSVMHEFCQVHLWFYLAGPALISYSRFLPTI